MTGRVLLAGSEHHEGKGVIQTLLYADFFYYYLKHLDYHYFVAYQALQI